MTEVCVKPIRIVLVDDHPVIREGLRSILSSFQEITIVGEAGSGLEAIAVARDLKPDVVVMDISMPEMSGIEATTALRREAPDVKVLALSMHANLSYIKQALAAGARGYLLKDAAPKDLVQAICNVHAGTTPISPEAASVLVGQSQTNGDELTARETDVLRYIARGYTNKEISAALNLGVRTVETHRQNLIKKTGLSTVAELTRFAITQGYVQLHPAQ
jgi:two-component system, NarL family, nitrate/nitrite response regulator NarL